VRNGPPDVFADELAALDGARVRTACSPANAAAPAPGGSDFLESAGASLTPRLSEAFVGAALAQQPCGQQVPPLVHASAEAQAATIRWAQHSVRNSKPSVACMPKGGMAKRSSAQSSDSAKPAPARGGNRPCSSCCDCLHIVLQCVTCLAYAASCMAQDGSGAGGSSVSSPGRGSGGDAALPTRYAAVALDVGETMPGSGQAGGSSGCGAACLGGLVAGVVGLAAMVAVAAGCAWRRGRQCGALGTLQCDGGGTASTPSGTRKLSGKSAITGSEDTSGGGGSRAGTAPLSQRTGPYARSGPPGYASLVAAPQQQHLWRSLTLTGGGG
jgi:hypothetical protein